jgi:hypothetical protein
LPLLLGFAAVLIVYVLSGASNWFHRRTSLTSTVSLIEVVLLLGIAIATLLWWGATATADKRPKPAIANLGGARDQRIYDLSPRTVYTCAGVRG